MFYSPQDEVLPEKTLEENLRILYDNVAEFCDYCAFLCDSFASIVAHEEVIDNTIRFVHDGGELAPSYEVKVSDGEKEINYEPAVITFNNINDVPVLVNNQLIILLTFFFALPFFKGFF